MMDDGTNDETTDLDAVMGSLRDSVDLIRSAPNRDQAERDAHLAELRRRVADSPYLLGLVNAQEELRRDASRREHAAVGMLLRAVDRLHAHADDLEKAAGLAGDARELRTIARDLAAVVDELTRW